MAAICALICAPPVEALPSSSGRCAQPGLQLRTNVRLPRVAGLSLKHVIATRRELLLCHAQGEGGSCCGGSGSGGSGGSCGSNGSRTSDVSGVGKEFEALVAKKTMEEFEKDYRTGPMEGTISRDIIKDVVNIYPDALAKENEEKFLDIDELLEEARSLSTSGGDFIFEADLDEMVV